MKGIVLAGGSGTRLHPVTRAVSKQLLPIYDKPLVYYPLSVLMLAEIRDILVITTPDDQPAFQRLLGDGRAFGVSLSYALQPSPDGIAQALTIARDFIAGDRVALALGDNLFFGHGLQDILRRAAARETGATVFVSQVRDAERYAVMDFAPDGRAIHIEEKPRTPRTPWAVTGLYFYDARAVEIAAALKPSSRGEIEITDVNARYLADGALHVERLGRGIAWLDTGTHESMLQAGVFIQVLEERQGLRVACLEEIAFRFGWISREQLAATARAMSHSGYGDYLRRLLEPA